MNHHRMLRSIDKCNLKIREGGKVHSCLRLYSDSMVVLNNVGTRQKTSMLGILNLAYNASSILLHPVTCSQNRLEHEGV